MEIINDALNFIGGAIESVATTVFDFFVNTVQNIFSSAMDFVSNLLGF